MDLKLEHGNIFFYFSEDTFIHTICEWRQLTGSWNWFTFTPLKVYVEKDCIIPGIEVETILLGLGFRFRHNFDAKMDEDLESSLEEAEEMMNNSKETS